MDEKYKVNHLILLVGGNPLPNAVAGRMLVKDGGRITLLHTVDTRGIADRLKIWFTQQGMAENRIDVRGTHRTHRRAIQSTVEQVVTKNEEGVGLNYTSGTSAMSVHVHTTVSQRASNPICSYLDAQSLCMIFDDGATAYAGLNSNFKLTIEQLFDLHGWYLHRKQPSILLPQVAEILYQEYRAAGFVPEDNPPNFIRKSRNWVTDEFNRVGKENGRWRDEAELAEITAKFPDDVSLKFAETLREELGVADALRFPLSQSLNLGFQEIKGFCEWFNGGWLESFVLDKLHQIKRDRDLSEIYMGVRASSQQSFKEGEPEFDVIAIRGYQLFFLSCSITNPKSRGARSLLKSKLFEAFVRGRQLAGTEVCVALICVADDADYPENDPLEQEAQQILQAKGRIKVFGRKHLPNLSQHLSKWIKEQSREGKTCPEINYS